MKFAALVAAGLITLTAPALAQYYVPRPMAPIGPMPPESVSEMVRQMGLEPVGAPVRSGPVYFQRAADYYGKPLRVVIDAQRAQVVSVEPVGGPPMLHGGPYASTGAPYWRRPYAYPYGGPDDEMMAPPGSAMTPHGLPRRAATPKEPPVPRKRPAQAPRETVGSVEAVHTPAEASPPAPAEKPAAPQSPANAMPPVTPLE